MAIHFIDEADNHGWISSDLDVEYDGPVDVNEYLNELFEEEMSFEEIADEIVIDMPLDLPIVEARREERPYPMSMT